MNQKKLLSCLASVISLSAIVCATRAQLPPGLQPAKPINGGEVSAARASTAGTSTAAPAAGGLQPVRVGGAVSADPDKKLLKVGDPAPALTVGKWMKGEPIVAFQPGKVYVVEFWATWCGPCKEVMPHLTELAHKYRGRVDFIGISINEVPHPKDTSYYTKVEKFVQSMGDQMDYHVAVDGMDGFISKNWFVASGEAGIPVAYVVDQKGAIAWIGHPGGDLDLVIEQVLAGTFAGADAARRHEAMRAKMEKAMTLRRAIVEAMKNRDFDQALAAIDASTEAFPEQAGGNVILKFQALAEKSGDAAAYEYARGVHAGTAAEVNRAPAPARPWIHYLLAAVIMDEATKLQVRDYDAALSYAKVAVLSDDPKEQVLYQAALAEAYYRKGDKQKAAEIAREATEKILALDGVQQPVKDRFIEELAKFQK